MGSSPLLGCIAASFMGKLEGWRSCSPLGGITVKFTGGLEGCGSCPPLGGIVVKFTGGLEWWINCPPLGGIAVKFMGGGEKQDASFGSWEATCSPENGSTLLYVDGFTPVSSCSGSEVSNFALLLLIKLVLYSIKFRAHTLI